MTLNWGYLFQQLLMVLAAGGLAGCLLVALRLLRMRSGSPGIRLLCELPALALVLGAVGMQCDRLGVARALPGTVLPWAVGVALAFYWMALWWPLRVLWQRRTLRGAVAGKLACGTAAASVLVACYALFVEPQLLEVERRTLTFSEIGGGEIRVAHVSDIQLVGLSPRDHALVDAVNAFDPHLIVLSGDYIAMSIDDDHAIESVRVILSRLRARHGIFATTSDSDTEIQRRRIFAGLPVHYLLNQSTRLLVEGVAVRVGGLSHFLPRWQRMAGAATDDELFVVACHSPDPVERTGELLPQADLYLCGHTHGGQLQIPGFGPILTFCKSPRHIAAGGKFRTSQGMPFLVSRGVGMEGGYAPRFRLLCRPHLFLLTLRGEGPRHPTVRSQGHSK